MHVKKRNLFTNSYKTDETLAKKPIDRLIKVIQNSPKAAISTNKDSQKTKSIIELDAHACMHPTL